MWFVLAVKNLAVFKDSKWKRKEKYSLQNVSEHSTSQGGGGGSSLLRVCVIEERGRGGCVSVRHLIYW